MQNRDYVRAHRPLVHQSNRSLEDDQAELPPAILKSRAPGILFAIVAFAALAGPIAWKVLRQNDAIQQAQSHPYTALSEPPHPAPPPAVELLPADTSASGAQVTTTGGVVPARSASVVAPTPEPGKQAAPAVAALAPAAPGVSRPAPAPIAPAAPLSVTAAPKPEAPQHPRHHAYRHHPTPAANPSDQPAATPSPPADDGNPYDDPTSAAETTPSRNLDKPKE